MSLFFLFGVSCRGLTGGFPGSVVSVSPGFGLRGFRRVVLGVKNKTFKVINR